jgi:hypothetical protein
MEFLNTDIGSEKRAWVQNMAALHRVETQKLVLIEWQESARLWNSIRAFELTLRNAIDFHYRERLGQNWLIASIEQDGVFNTVQCRSTLELIKTASSRIKNPSYSDLVASLTLSFWARLFEVHQFEACGSTLVEVFTEDRTNLSARRKAYVVRLKKILGLRNRIAHHEWVVYRSGMPKLKITKVCREIDRERLNLLKKHRPPAVGLSGSNVGGVVVDKQHV